MDTLNGDFTTTAPLLEHDDEEIRQILLACRLTSYMVDEEDWGWMRMEDRAAVYGVLRLTAHVVLRWNASRELLLRLTIENLYDLYERLVRLAQSRVG